MTTEFKLPELGENIESGDVVSVLVAVGDTIKENDPVLELETDKATLEVPSSISGVVEAIHVAAGDTISVGQVILTTNGDGTAPAPAEPQAAAPQEAKTAPASAPAPEPAPTPSAEAAPVATEAGPVEFKLPDLGENIESGDVVNVLVSVGDTIGENDPVLELETDKATLEVPSSVGGTIEAIHVNAGDTISVGQIILTLKGGAPAGAPPKPAKPAETPAVTPPAEPEPAEAEEAPAKTLEPQVIEFKLPDLGENIESGSVVSVLVAPGDTIAQGDSVLELETDKATLEVPSDVGGTVKEVLVKEGDDASVGQAILTVETTAAESKPPAKPKPAEKEAPAPAPPAAKAEAQPEEPAAATAPVAASKAAPQAESRLVPAPPNTRRMARELGVDVSKVTGTGVEGRITIDDVKRHARELLTEARPSAPPAAAPATRREVKLPDFSLWGEIETVPMKGIRKATANQMDLAWSTIPHVTNFDKANISELENLRKRFGPQVEAAGGKLTVTAILIKLVAAALKKFPQFNASVDLANQKVIYKKYYNVGVAVDTDRGLLVPVIKNVDQKNIQEIAVELGEVSVKARDGKLSLDEMQGGNFTITNLGGIGGTNFTPIVNHPEVAILGIARGGREPVFNPETGQFEPKLMLPLALSYDHRLIDGADAARFLRWLVGSLEEPFMMALQGW